MHYVLNRVVPSLYWFRVPREVFRDLRRLGFHGGYWRDNDIDNGLRAAFQKGLPREKKIAKLHEWAAFIDREASLLAPGYASLWYPELDDDDCQLIREVFNVRLVEIEADSTRCALHLACLTRWHFGIFYHVACMGNWKAVVLEQLGLLSRVGLSGIRVSFLGSDGDLAYFTSVATRYGVDFNVIYHHTCLEVFEVPVIRAIEEWISRNPHSYVLYFHTKGVSSPDNAIKIRWRRLMQRFVLERWRENADYLLRGADVVGVNWVNHQVLSHFPGNFWMARAEYLRSLESFAHYYRNPRHDCRGHINHWRLGPEFWIGAAQKPPSVHTHVSVNRRLDSDSYWDECKSEKRSYLALCLWCKDEHQYLDEWIRYHLGIGVDHIYIYDNNSGVAMTEWVAEHIASGHVTLMGDRSTKPGRQCEAYVRLLKEFGSLHEWIGFIDTDEFVVPKNGKNLAQFLAAYESFGGVGVFWYCFGANGHDVPQPSVTRAYTTRTPEDFDYNDHIKTFVRTPHVLCEPAVDPHHFKYKDGYCCVDEHKRPIAGARRRPRSSELIQINHYITRSRAEWAEKMQRGGGNGIRRTARFFENVDAASKVYDSTIQSVVARHLNE